MLLQIHLPDREETLAYNHQRWAEVLNDPQWNNHPYRIETNAFGQIIMTPPPGGPHCSKQSQIAFLLQTRLRGRALVEVPISTVDGVKAVDAAWYSSARYEQVRGQITFEIAPEICVEVLSPSNKKAEMQTKRKLYFDAGAIECWTCDLNGQMTYYDLNNPEAPLSQSKLCPDFPAIIND